MKTRADTLDKTKPSRKTYSMETRADVSDKAKCSLKAATGSSERRGGVKARFERECMPGSELRGMLP